MITISAKSVIKLHPLERQVLDTLLTLADRKLSICDLKLLSIQLRHAIILSREMTGHGFYTRFSIGEGALRLPNHQSFWFGTVSADIPGLEHGAGFQLYIKDGAASELEGFCYLGPWPDPWPGQIDESQIYDVYALPRFENQETKP